MSQICRMATKTGVATKGNTAPPWAFLLDLGPPQLAASLFSHPKPLFSLPKPFARPWKDRRRPFGKMTRRKPQHERRDGRTDHRPHSPVARFANFVEARGI